jgi:hypothetical protein
VSNNNEFIFFENKASVLLTYDTLHTIPTIDTTEITWEAGDTTLDRVLVKFDINDIGIIQNMSIQESIFDRVTNIIETCVFMSKINVITSSSNAKVFESWLPDITRITDIEQFRVQPINNSNPFVFSNLIWKNIHPFIPQQCIKHVNLALTVEDSSWKTITKHKLKKIKEQWNSKNIHILSINALFYNKEGNVFNTFHNFVSHFKLILDYACILGCRYVIYGSPESKSLYYTKIDKYETYQQAHQTFIETMRGLAEYAKSRHITIIIKPNTRSNYLCNRENSEEIVAAIDHSHVQSGQCRGHIYTQFNDFNLVEFIGDEKSFELLLHKITLLSQ